MSATYKNFISAEELKNLLETAPKDVVVLDGTYSPNALMNFQGAHIPTSQWFDIDDIADLNAPFLHTFPSADVFAQKLSEMGIKNSDHVIVYDQSGFYMAAARVWWMFKAFGHEKVSVLNGGLPAWIGYKIETGASAPRPQSSYKAQNPEQKVKSAEDVLRAIDTNNQSILDFRDTGRFNMAHIPTSQNAFFGKFLNADGTIKAKEELENLVSSLQLDKNHEQICSCGSGVTACVGLLVLDELGFEKTALFDGSWTEWSSQERFPKASGA